MAVQLAGCASPSPYTEDKQAGEAEVWFLLPLHQQLQGDGTELFSRTWLDGKGTETISLRCCLYVCLRRGAHHKNNTHEGLMVLEQG